ncbi:hypothetical protein QBC35DRAFT_510061 [Podospora australis]|uniref:Uncharacterized protein n=1 Tax=Podospora australis TaxID=1536484 RepID=A0AAN6WI99_9PEZI|nr:hypothetical protein QBC35DRAFT_510061 [Podospora australis]
MVQFSIIICYGLKVLVFLQSGLRSQGLLIVVWLPRTFLGSSWALPSFFILQDFRPSACLIYLPGSGTIFGHLATDSTSSRYI